MNTASGEMIRLPSSVIVVSPESAKALEQAWQHRRQELAGWQPSGGWLSARSAARQTPSIHRNAAPKATRVKRVIAA